MFSDIEILKTDKSQNAIHEASSENIFYRARVFENIEDAEKALEHPERFFGPPPNELARSGRMNAHGIPVFYGATAPAIAVAEVRPVVGCYVVVVPFRPLRELKILDISALNNLTEVRGSVFDQRVANLNDKANFMRTLSRKLTLPVSGKNPENEYLITHAVSEYLSVSDKYRLDGISFDSTQHPRRKRSACRHQNVVLFSKSSAIKGAEPDSRSYNIELFEHVEEDIWMFAPTIQPLERNKRNKYSFSCSSEKQNYSLEILSDSIVFHKVKGVYYEPDPTDISLLEPLFPKDGTQLTPLKMKTSYKYI
ncbi:RES family NAD+ phosphorylase (plasmid) [Erwinia pyri]|uniref:RES family NAD+ phosphorylase n=1 Tax=Erwinia pyri TaxID=3062598 RepID=A0AA50DNL2_9GAMM|nr:RES family NAD+ phosphorylase [Erwinia sp. DE2]WLS81057.1 RES family NAD+ phosphorylase [Erwinia sp. DE2]